MKKKIPLCILAVGILVLITPKVLMKYNDYQYEQKITAFQEQQSHTDADKKKALLEKMQEYNERLYKENQDGIQDPFSYESSDFDLKSFGLSEEYVGFVEIPSIDIKAPIYLGATSAHMKQGAVHLGKTSLPVGGENTNSVIAAHRGTYDKRLFRDIDDIAIGDEIRIENFYETLVYKAVKIKIIDPTDSKDILIQPGKDMVTLFSCHPYFIDTQRYVVYCERVK